MPRESEVQREILRLWGAHPKVRLWRANSGRALVATATGGLRSMQVNIPGCPDAIGWTSVDVDTRLLHAPQTCFRPRLLCLNVTMLKLLTAICKLSI